MGAKMVRATSSAYLYRLVSVSGKSAVYTLLKQGARTDPCVTPFLVLKGRLACPPLVYRTKDLEYRSSTMKLTID